MSNYLDIFTLPAAVVEASLFAEHPEPAANGHKTVITSDGEVIDLTVWTAQYGPRFQLVDALKMRMPGIFTPRVKGVKHHIRCPNTGDHITGGADVSGTFIVNAGDLPKAGLPQITRGFVIHCSHNGCAGRDRLDHIAAMLADGTLAAEDLTNEEFLLPEELPIDISGLRTRAEAQAEGASGSEGDKSNDWPPPIPLPTLPIVPVFDMSLLPDKLAAWVADAADRARFAPDFPAVTAMSAVGSLLGRRLGVRLKAKDDWTEFGNVWAISVGLSSALKSPGMRAAMSQLRRLQAGEDEKADRADLIHKSELAMAKIRNESEKDKAKAALKRAPDSAIKLVLEQEPTPPPRRTLVTSDVTVEKLGEILKANPNGLLIERDELSSWLTSLEDEKNATARGFFLSGWSGSEAYRFDRIGRGTVALPTYALSVVGGIQPGPLERYVRGAFSGQRADGLLQRFQLAVWPEPAKFEYVDRYPNKSAKEDAWDLFKLVDTFDPMSIGTHDTFGHAPPFIRLDSIAQGLFAEWFTSFMTTLRNCEAAGEEIPALSSHFGKYPGLVGKLALIIHVSDFPAEKEISERTILKALAWLEYLAPHARRIYHGASSPDADAARLLLARIKSGKVKSPFKAREVYRNGWHGLGNAEHVKSACRVLMDYGYLREAGSEAQSNGRPSDPTYLINPRVFG